MMIKLRMINFLTISLVIKKEYIMLNAPKKTSFNTPTTKINVAKPNIT